MLSVVFNRTSPVYTPGELLSGDVVITASTEFKILDLTVNYCGISSVGFVVSKGEGNSQTCEKVEETDTHLDVLHPLIRSYRGVVVEPGVHTYDFSLKLPSLLPSSYKSPYGHISYYINVHLITSKDTSEVRKPYVVRAPVNINLFISGQNPKCAEVIVKYGLISNKSLRLKASVSKTCFVPGEVIPVLIEVTNDTTRELRYLFCTLKQVTNVLVQLQEQTVNRVTKQCLITVAHKMVKDRGYHSWLCQLPSPNFLTPTIAASTIVFVTYSIQVSATLKRVPIPPDLQIPIVFGIRAPVLPQRTSPRPNDTNFVRRVSQQHLPSVHSSFQRRNNLLSSVAKIMRQSGRQPSPTVAIPRRRVTVVSQPRINFSNLPRRGSCQPKLSSSSTEDGDEFLPTRTNSIGENTNSSNRDENNFKDNSRRSSFQQESNMANSSTEISESSSSANNLRRNLLTSSGQFENSYIRSINQPELNELNKDNNTPMPTVSNPRKRPIMSTSSDEFEDSLTDLPRRNSYQLDVAELLRENSTESLPVFPNIRRRQPIIVSNLRRGSCQLKPNAFSLLETADKNEPNLTDLSRIPMTFGTIRRGSCQPQLFSRRDSSDSIDSSDTRQLNNDSTSPRTIASLLKRSSSFQVQFSVTNLIRDDRSETPPTAINPRRRITVSTQPQISFAPSPSRVSQWQTIASSITQRLGNQLNAFLPSWRDTTDRNSQQ